MAAEFEIVSKYKDKDLTLPNRATVGSAGYDFTVAEDTLVPAIDKLKNHIFDYAYDNNYKEPFTLSAMENITKLANARPTLVPTGIKCKLDEGTYLELSVRSSTPLKTWLILANGVGIIDRDYWNNASNEGEIFFQLINLGTYDILLKKGDKIGQGIIKKYEVTENDMTTSERTGGFGSTS